MEVVQSIIPREYILLNERYEAGKCLNDETLSTRVVNGKR